MAFTKIVAAGIGSTGTVTLENLVVTGSVTGAVTGNATGLSGTPNITVGTIGATSLNASGVVTATTFSGALTGNVTGNINSSGVSTFGNTVVGGGTTQLVVTGNARITGILTIGTSSITLDGSNNQVNVGTGVTINSSGVTVTGVVTATTFSGDLTGNATGLSGTPNITVGSIIASNATISGNVSVAGTLTYEDVTNVDSVGLVTARTGVRIDAGGLVVVGVTTVAAGSVSAPSITPTGDSNTGIFFPSADTVAIAEGGVEALRIDSSGNIGVNTISTNPLGNGGTFKNLTVFTPGGYAAFGGISDLTASGSTIAAFNAGTLGASGGKNAASINIELDATSTTNANGRIVFYTTASGSVTEKARITSTGNVQIANGNLVFSTAGTGIDFSATANSSGTMTSELLSDYEEGTWTPQMGTDASYTITHTSQVGRYTKIGNTVFIECFVAWSAWTGGGNVYLTNLPFILRTASNAASTAFPVCASATTGIKNYQFRFDVATSSTATVYLYNFENTAFTSIATIGTNSHVVVRGHYQVP